MSVAAIAEPPCGGVIVSDLVETAPGELTPVGERCPGAPLYYDAPGRSFLRVGLATYYSVGVTHFESSAIEALGAMSMEDLVNPFPAGQGEANFRPE
jgi:hypothetical protein